MSAITKKLAQSAGPVNHRLQLLVMARGLWILLLLASAQGGERLYELAGQIQPETSAEVFLHGATTPFSAATRSDPRGRFRFRKLPAGAYTLAVYVPGSGEVRQTVEVGPSLAVSKGRVNVTVDTSHPQNISSEVLLSRSVAPARQLTVPPAAYREYSKAEKRLARRDVAGAVGHLDKAVKIAPQFSAAWNGLGVIAYQSRDFPRAKKNFREALEQDPEAFEPLVNLGGVLLTLGELDEALKFNLYAVLRRPKDALANSQLGLNYFVLGDLDRGLKYLTIAKGIDPAHFSHPQLTLAEIHLRRNERQAAVAELEDFLERHPDSPEAEKIRSVIARLR
ncbi:MAG: tetratricopeptide repeat protein [Acidobacteria bacterium]|nr:tetratricopeptide repeat protein [Acidobacteriota bacterium]